MKTLPKARQEGIIVRELPDEVLIYDRQRDQAHCLNRTAGFIWQHCDGRTRIATIARMLATKEHTPVDEAVILLALDQLAERHLLDGARPPGKKVSRRKLVLKYAPAALALPVILSITAPTAAQAATPTPTPTPDPCAVQTNKPQGCPCTDDNECDSFNCNAGVCGPALQPKPE